VMLERQLEPDGATTPVSWTTRLAARRRTQTGAVQISPPELRIAAIEPGRNHTLWWYGRSLSAKGVEATRILD